MFGEHKMVILELNATKCHIYIACSEFYEHISGTSRLESISTTGHVTGLPGIDILSIIAT